MEWKPQLKYKTHINISGIQHKPTIVRWMTQRVYISYSAMAKNPFIKASSQEANGKVVSLCSYSIWLDKQGKNVGGHIRDEMVFGSQIVFSPVLAVWYENPNYSGIGLTIFKNNSLTKCIGNCRAINVRFFIYEVGLWEFLMQFEYSIWIQLNLILKLVLNSLYSKTILGKFSCFIEFSFQFIWFI